MVNGWVVAIQPDRVCSKRLDYTEVIPTWCTPLLLCGVAHEVIVWKSAKLHEGGWAIADPLHQRWCRHWLGWLLCRCLCLRPLPRLQLLLLLLLQLLLLVLL